MRNNWNRMSREDRIAFIRDGVAQKMSARDIADQIDGCTRNMIIGLAFRAKIDLGGKKQGKGYSPRPIAKPDWTKFSPDEKASFVRTGFEQGYTAENIANRLLNATEKAIIRCAERNRISRRIAKVKIRKEPDRPFSQYFPEFSTDPVNIMDLLSGHCRGPMWEDKPKRPMRSPEDWNFCGRPVKAGSSFCPECHEKFWRKPNPPKRFEKRRYVAERV